MNAIIFKGTDDKDLRVQQYYSAAAGGPALHLTQWGNVGHGAHLDRESVEYLRDYLTTWLEDEANASKYDELHQIPSISIRVPSAGSETMRAHWFALGADKEVTAFEAVTWLMGKPDIRRAW